MKIFIIGYPLSGKTTIGKNLASKLGYEYLSTGEYARQLGMTMEDSIITHDISLKFNDMINQRVSEVLQGDCVIDGYPRSLEQILKIKDIKDKRVIYFYCNPLIIQQRLSNRFRSDDTIDIVASRVKSAMRLKYNIAKYMDIEVYDTADQEALRIGGLI